MSEDEAVVGLWVDFRELSPVLRPHVVELLGRLGPPPEVFDDPLAALAASHADPAQRPVDPVMARLLPDGVMADDEAAVEFRRFSHDTLRARKRRDATFLLRLLDDGATSVDREQALQLMGAFNDLRLMLGTVLNVTEQGTVEPLTEEDQQAYAAYELLAWLLEDLVAVVASSGGETDPGPGSP